MYRLDPNILSILFVIGLIGFIITTGMHIRMLILKAKSIKGDE